MNPASNSSNLLINLDYMSIIMFWIVLLAFAVVALNGSIAPIILYACMIAIGTLLIGIFSKNDEIFLKIKLFTFFFSLYAAYTLSIHYILLDDSSDILRKIFNDERTIYNFSYQGLPYISGEKKFFDLFSLYEINGLPLHVVFSSVIAYLSIMIDGINGIVVQKLLSPFFGGLFMVVLYSTLKYHFKDAVIAINATIIYGLFSAIFMYSTVILRDVDIALAYMLFFYLFLQKDSIVNVLLLLFISFMTYYLRHESGLVLYALTFLNIFISVKKLNNQWLKSIVYILLFSLFMVFVYFSIPRLSSISEKYADKADRRSVASMAQTTGSSLSRIFEKLPFGLSHSTKVLFGQIKPFPILKDIDKPLTIMSGIFWPFVFIMMLYGVIHKNIRDKIDIKIKYLLMVSIAILFLMSAEPHTRRMLSVYPVIYITAIYTFYFVSKNKINKMFYMYLFSIISLNTFYYLLKI